MKKVLALIIFLFSFSFLYASDFFQLTFGANISFEKIDIKDTDTTKDIVKNLISVGLDMRMLFKYVQVGYVGNMSVIDKKTLLFNGLSYLGASVQVFNRVDLGFALGPNMNYLIKDNGANKYVDGDGDTDSSIDNYFSALFQGNYSYRLTAEALISKVMKVGLAVTIPTHFNLQTFRITKLWPESSDFKNIGISLSVQMRLI